MSERKTRVFVSYSRDDVEFVDALLKGLQLAGFEGVYDLEHILGGEAWEARLQAMISQCDIFCPVLSPNWNESKTCIWEAEQARISAKRILPILYLSSEDTEPPKWIRALNYVRFDGAESYTEKLLKLAEALRSDVEWYRASNALLMRAESWQSGAKEIILRGSEITAAQELINSRPQDAPEPTKLQLDFLAHSETEERIRDASLRKKLDKERQLLNRIRLGLSVFAMVLASAGIFIAQQKSELRRAQLRLDEGLSLVLADTQRRVTGDSRWVRLATEHKLAFADLIITGRNSTPTGRGSGFLVPGSVFSEDWSDKTVLMTAGHLFMGLGEAEIMKQIDTLISVSFPAHKDEKKYVVSDVLYFSPAEELDVALLELSGPAPRHATTIWPEENENTADPSQDGFGGIGILNWNVRDNFSLSFGHRVALPEGKYPWEDFSIAYTDMTGPGASGSPVFDMDTSNLLCMHQRAGEFGTGQLRSGACISIEAILQAVKSGLAD